MQLLSELMSYVAFTDADAARLRALEPALRPRFGEFAVHFYEVVDRHPRAAAVFSGPDQVERLRVSLVDWMTTGLLGPHDAAWYARRSRIGERHVAIGLPQEYMFTAMNVLRLDYRAAIGAALPPEQAFAAIDSVDKLFDIELAIMLRHYQHASEAALVAHERDVQADKLAAMRTLSAGLAHEVRNPLNAARLQLELLDRRLRRVTDDDRLRMTVDQIEHEIDRLTQLLNEFLAFAQPPALATASRDLVALVKETVEHERPRAADAEVELAVVAAAPRVLANVDPARFAQIASALIRNAVEATPPGGRVTIELAETAEGPQLRVIDRGKGIPSGTRERIFEPFFSTKPDGTGLGLALVHSLVSAHAGMVEVDTELGRGTTFKVTLPPA